MEKFPHKTTNCSSITSKTDTTKEIAQKIPGI
jgi:hypothetical protein